MTGRKYHGEAGHIVGSQRCCFHLHTSVNGYRVSTVGCYHPEGLPDTPVEVRKYERGG